MKSVIYFISVCLLTLLSSCEYEYYTPLPTVSRDSVSFSKDIIPIFSSECLNSGCHVTNGGAPPNLEKDYAYISLTGGNYLDTLKPAESVLYKRIISNGSPMPPSGKMLEKNISKILNWIKQGANNN